MLILLLPQKAGAQSRRGQDWDSARYSDAAAEQSALGLWELLITDADARSSVQAGAWCRRRGRGWARWLTLVLLAGPL